MKKPSIPATIASIVPLLSGYSYAEDRPGTSEELWAKPVNINKHSDLKDIVNTIKPYFNVAIKKAENNPNNFGVLSEKVNSPVQANQILNNSIQNNFLRWIQAGSPGKFVDFMQQRWAPIGAENDPDNLNKNWAPNVRKFLRKMLGEEGYENFKKGGLVKKQEEGNYV